MRFSSHRLPPIMCHIFGQRRAFGNNGYFSEARILRKDLLRRSSTFPSSSKSKTESIFNAPSGSSWDHIFDGVEDHPPLLPEAHNPANRYRDKNAAVRRQTMTTREASAFKGMFDTIFDLVQEQESRGMAGWLEGESPTNLGGLYERMNLRSKKSKWTAETDEVLDRKKEDMDRCDTDQELLVWALTEVFGEDERADAENRLQPETYPFLIAHLMRTFRDRYRDPHLALAIFAHAQHKSVASYVFGCGTQAYNELIETRWLCFRDLRGICDALEEMAVNGVEFDNRTWTLAEQVRRDVGERSLDEDDFEFGGEQKWAALDKIEKLLSTRADRFGKESGFLSSLKPGRWGGLGEPWKRPDLDDDWEFDSWGSKDRINSEREFLFRG